LIFPSISYYLNLPAAHSQDIVKPSSLAECYKKK